MGLGPHRLVVQAVGLEPLIHVVGWIVDETPFEELYLVLEEPTAQILAAVRRTVHVTR